MGTDQTQMQFLRSQFIGVIKDSPSTAPSNSLVVQPTIPQKPLSVRMGLPSTRLGDRLAGVSRTLLFAKNKQARHHNHPSYRRPLADIGQSSSSLLNRIS
jgi:hypothetical protein